MSHKASLAIFFIIASCALPAALHAQTIQCDTPAQKVACQAALTEAEAEAKAAQAELDDAQAQSASLSQAISVLDAKIKVSQANIKAKNLLIQSLGNDVASKQSHINDLEDQIAQGKETLSQVLRKTSEIDNYSLPEVLLSQSSIAGFFEDVDTFQSVQQSLATVFDQLRSDEASTSAEKDALNQRITTETDARHAIQQEQANIQDDEDQKQQLLATSKGNEKTYTSLVAQKAAQAAQIRAALFPLAGGGQAIPFGDALKYANEASQKTGVRPAFLLAILTQESALGANVGACYLADSTTGAGVNAKTGAVVAKVMSPTRDVPPFIQIVNSLGSDPYKAVVSCPQSVGWGGAMGPAQFIASTWMLFADRVAAAVGTTGIPSPWVPQNAFMASALYLGDLGAGAGGYTAERNAACRYYSGSVCSKSSLIASYGNSVVSKADTIQTTMIDPLSGN